MAIVNAHKFSSPTDKMVELFELTIAKCRMYVTQPVIESQKLLFIVPATVLVIQQLACISGNSMTPEHLQHRSKLFIIGGDHPAFATGNDFYRVKTEHNSVAVKTISYWLGLVRGADRV